MCRLTLLNLCREACSHPEVGLKRDLYAKLPTTEFGTQFKNNDELSVEHTLLAHLVAIVCDLLEPEPESTNALALGLPALRARARTA